MPLNMFFIKICISDHSSQLAFLPIACSWDICNPKYDDHSFYAKFGMNSFRGCGREDNFACQNICNC